MHRIATLHPQGHAAALWGAVLVGMAMESVIRLASPSALAAVRPRGTDPRPVEVV